MKKKQLIMISSAILEKQLSSQLGGKFDLLLWREIVQYHGDIKGKLASILGNFYD